MNIYKNQSYEYLKRLDEDIKKGISETTEDIKRQIKEALESKCPTGGKCGSECTNKCVS